MTDALPRPVRDLEAAEIADLVSRMTLAQKSSMTAGRDMWGTVPVPEHDIPSWRMTDGPNGARGTMFGPAAVRALCMPSGTALGATWDPVLIAEVGAVLGKEARGRAARVLLAPTVNLHRSPLSGRTFECFSEDPCLAGVLAVAYIRGVQGEGVITTVKHFAGNEAEFERNSINSIIDERSLRELYLAPFEAAIREGGSLGVMTSYNRLNGSFCADDDWLLGTILRGEWGFEGIVVTDWWALSSTEDAANAGLDIEMPGPGRSFGTALTEAVERGDVPAARLDRIVERILTTMTRIDARHDASDGPEVSVDDPALLELARRASADSMVLVKNEGRLLPLAADSLRRVAVIGPNADRSQIMGGGSASLRAHHRTSPLKALLAALPGADVDFARGCSPGESLAVLEPTEMTAPSGEPGIEVSFFAGPVPDGEPIGVHCGDTTQLQFMGDPAPGVPAESFSLRAVTSITATDDGEHRFRLTSNGAARLLLDGQVVADLGWGDPIVDSRQREGEATVALTAGTTVELTIEFAGSSVRNLRHVSLGCARPTPDDMIETAVELARAADVAIVVVGTSQTVESEGYDRTDLALPGDQDELIRRVASANPNTVVVVNSGSPVSVPWIDDVPVVLQSWFGGQEMAAAIADVLLGAREPSGRMPLTFPARIEDTPAFGNFPGEAGTIRYGEGVLVGYRWYEARLIEPAIPFGHGLGYTTFEWSDATLSATVQAADAIGVTVGVDVTNTGDRAGSDVVQVFVSPPKSPLTRAPKELRGFAKVRLQPGETRRVDIELGTRSFAYWHPGDSESVAIQQRLVSTPFARLLETGKRATGWTVEPGVYGVHLARSSADVVTSLELRVDGLLEGQLR